MNDISFEIAVDGELGRRAIEAVNQYLQEHGRKQYRKPDEWPIPRSQIAGLRQIAANEPAQLARFAEHQRKKVAAKLEETKREGRRRDLEAQVAFWKCVEGLCEGKPPQHRWSLRQECEAATPPELREEPLALGAKLSQAEQTARKKLKSDRERWQDQWRRRFYPAFFQRFCIHYLYEMSRRTQSTEHEE